MTQEAFDRLLLWLDPDRARAGERYEEIRRRLIKIFINRGCAGADELADETINRVARRLPEVASTYVGYPALYFYGVAQRVHLEYLKSRQLTGELSANAPSPTPEEGLEPELTCLEECVARLTAQNRELILLYYRDEGQAKIEERKRLAERLGIGTNALRIRAHRIRAGLQECVLACLARKRTR